ncbi:MAG: transglutaminase domain-containing protein [Verrucomicrobiaceae bacterium]|nr:MAG: transglutaminase domain-containing protein [Verrucomicrobiaceae bacterium]
MHSLMTPLGSGPLSELFRERGCDTLGEASGLLAAIPYGRPTGQGNERVLLERRGTCSSKHALFVSTCREANVRARLVVGFFLMNEANVPGVGRVLSEAGLGGIWEAHCVAELPDGRVDITGLPSGNRGVDLQGLVDIEPDAIGEKTDLHRAALRCWAEKERLPMALDELWVIRERCIAALG